MNDKHILKIGRTRLTLGTVAQMLKTSKTFDAVEVRGDLLLLRSILGGRMQTTALKVAGDRLWIEPTGYMFKSRNAHYDYCMPETRWTRQKGNFRRVVKALKVAHVWKFIDNKVFFQINENNSGIKSAVRNRLQKEFKELTSKGE